MSTSTYDQQEVLATEPERPDRVPFSWHRDDIECRLGLKGGRFTRVNMLLWLFVAMALTVGAYGIMSFFPKHRLVQMFTQRGPCQYVTLLFSFWCLLILLVKHLKTRLQRRALRMQDLVPYHADFVLSPATVGEVLARLRQACDDPSRFILFNRIETALCNLKNMGRIGDVDDVLRSQAENDEDVMESSYSILKGLIWAIPVLGFIGTVQGLSFAIGSFGQVLSSGADISQLTPALQNVTTGLATAFETTYVALVAALAIQLLLTAIRKNEEELLDACQEYCQKHIVGKLRLTAFDEAG